LGVFPICCVNHLPHDLQRQRSATLAHHLLSASELELRRRPVKDHLLDFFKRQRFQTKDGVSER
jgi:hypothetical protein